MPEMHLKQQIIYKLYTNTNYTYQNDLDKACFQHDMAYGKYKDLTKRTQLDKVLKDKTFKIASNSKYDGYQRGLASMAFKFLIKRQKVVVLNLYQISYNFQLNFINRVFENLKKGKYILLLKTIFWELILLICN